LGSCADGRGAAGSRTGPTTGAPEGLVARGTTTIGRGARRGACAGAPSRTRLYRSSASHTSHSGTIDTIRPAVAHARRANVRCFLLSLQIHSIAWNATKKRYAG